MRLHGGLMLPILFIVVSCPLTLHARKVAPLIEDDWARRPHRAAGKSAIYPVYLLFTQAFVERRFLSRAGAISAKRQTAQGVTVSVSQLTLEPFLTRLSADFVRRSRSGLLSFKGQRVPACSRGERVRWAVLRNIKKDARGARKKKEARSVSARTQHRRAQPRIR